MLRERVALPVSYFPDDDALTLYFVPFQDPKDYAGSLPCGWCTSRNAMINVDVSHEDTLLSLEVLDVSTVVPRDFAVTLPRRASVASPRGEVGVPIAYFPWTDELRFTFTFATARVEESAVCGEWNEIGRDIRLELDAGLRLVRMWVKHATQRIDPWLLSKVPTAGRFGS